MYTNTTGAFLINDEHLKINRILQYIIILNTLDGILTYIGVSNGYIFEMNKLMIYIVSDFSSLLIYKLFIPTCILLWVMLVINLDAYKRMPLGFAMIRFCFCVYSFIMAMHGSWLLITAYRFFS